MVIGQILAVWGQLLQRLQVGFYFYMWSGHIIVHLSLSFMDVYHCPYSVFHQNGTQSHQGFLQGNALVLSQATARPVFLSMGHFLVPLGVSWLCASSQLSCASPGWGLCSLGILYKRVIPQSPPFCSPSLCSHDPWLFPLMSKAYCPWVLSIHLNSQSLGP